MVLSGPHGCGFWGEARDPGVRRGPACRLRPESGERPPCPLRAAGDRWHGLCYGPSLRSLRQLSLDKELIDFGSYVVGETTSRVITLTNAGGLGTAFRLLPVSEACDNTDTSRSILKMVRSASQQGRGGPGPRPRPRPRGRREREAQAWALVGPQEQVQDVLAGPGGGHQDAGSGAWGRLQA